MTVEAFTTPLDLTIALGDGGWSKTQIRGLLGHLAALANGCPTDLSTSTIAAYRKTVPPHLLTAAGATQFLNGSKERRTYRFDLAHGVIAPST